MDTHETTVRIADLRERFDHARQGKPLNGFGPAYAELVALDSAGDQYHPAADPPLDDTAGDDETDQLES